ncbi:cellulose synthase catalytic subunit [Escherichia coli]|uniref:Cellulose synthase catalytic subunit n=1 Tax=Escherichia coli TaxID=562 RepID=A0A484Y495_ECOLX|nr:cellulose synthase catalytic subunit [Escherichia coli]
MLTVVVSMVWVFYNLIILGGAVAVSVESKQVRRSHRVEMTMPAAIAREDGHLFSCTVQDFSDGGLGIKINGQAQILEGQKVNLLLKRGQQEYVFPAQVARVMGNEVGLKLMPLTTQQHIDFVQCTFARADTWALWQDSYPEDKPLESLLDILKLGFRGYPPSGGICAFFGEGHIPCADFSGFLGCIVYSAPPGAERNGTTIGSGFGSTMMITR